MSLSEYRKKRKFQATPEPSGEAIQPSQDGPLRFVVQKHAARQLHYDLRLEYDGVLKSWAVPKGPSLDPTDKRLAIHVEDHPVEYLEFEGVIPAGEYGAGAMMVWDHGTWTPVAEAPGYEHGQLKFELNGDKLQGRWMLVKTGRGPDRENQWLLFKERDGAARSVSEINVLEAYPNSVVTGRSLEEIRAENDSSRFQGRVSTSPSTAKSAVAESSLANVSPSELPGARKAAMPSSISACLPTSVKEAPRGDAWIHEIKFDGYRMIAFKDARSVRLISRNGRDWTDRFPHIETALRRLPASQAILDGEIVFLGETGVTDFQQLQGAIRGRDRATLRYVVFDMMFADGWDLTSVPLLERKRCLESQWRRLPAGTPIDYSEHLDADGPLVFQQICQLGAEGIISKRRNGTYVSGRSDQWVKVKSVQSDDFLIGGYTESTVDRRQIGALHIGYFDEENQLRYAGRVGTGFAESTLTELYEQLQPLRQKSCPFTDFSADSATKRKSVWVDPQLIAEVEYGNFTRDGRVRFARFKGLRDDLPETEVLGATAIATTETEEPILLPIELPDGLRDLTLTHPDRILFPQSGTTKLGLASYYAQVARWMLPHLVGRPLSLLRGPKGSGDKCFFQKRPPAGLPDVVRRVFLGEAFKPSTAMVIEDLTGLLALVQFGVLEFHIWQARCDRIDRPDRVVFDLDPDTDLPWSRVVEAGRMLHEMLTELGLHAFANVTGGKGLHVVVPIQRRTSWEMTKSFSEQVAIRLQTRSPGRFTTNISKRARSGKIFIDYLRNSKSATAIAPFSTRANASPTVAMPVHWHELEHLSGGHPFTIDTALRRLGNLGEDPWAEYFEVRQAITRRVFDQL